MAFSDDDRDRVRAATNIVDLVGEVTTVRRSGRNHMAICVFHQEKSPSMSLDTGRGLFYCHGCHTSGDIFDFVMETRGLSFPDALEFLAGRAGITLTADPAAKRRAGRKRALTDAVAAAVDFYNRRLMKGPDAGHARSYLRSRGYSGDVVAAFKLGYAPSGDHLVRELRSRGIDERVMVEAGLARRGRGGGLYDYFRDRLMFPTSDVRGDPVGFGGRILGEGQPKYLNTPETPVYKKSRLLYGLDRARSAIQKANEAVVVEGYTDVIGCHLAGLDTAVATNGTALGDDHFDLLRRFCDRIVLAFDADAAGAGAALRGESLALPVQLDLDVRVAAMPPGEDPADLVQHGKADVLTTAVSESRPLVQFWIERRLDGFPLDEPEGRARALHAVGPRLAAIDDDIVRTEYARFVASRLGVELATVEQAVGRRSRRKPAGGPIRHRRPDPRRVDVEKELLRALLAGRRDGIEAESLGPELFTDDIVRQAYVATADGIVAAEEGTAVRFDRTDDAAGTLLVQLVMDGRPTSPPSDLLRRIRRFEIDAAIAEARTALAAVPVADQPASPAARELVRLEQERRSLEGTHER